MRQAQRAHGLFRRDTLLLLLGGLAGVFWAVASDQLLARLVPPADFAGWDAIKDVCFVFLAVILGGLLVRRAERARREAEARVAASQARFRQLVESSPDGIAVLQDERIAFANASALELLGAGGDAGLAGRSICDFVDPADLEAARRLLARAAAGGGEGSAQLRALRLDGTPFRAEIRLAPVEHQGRPAIQLVARDVTEPLRLQEELGRVNRALRLLGAANEALVRAESEAGLLGEICRIAVEVGGYRLAWVGLAEPDPGRRVRVTVRHGLDDGYLDGLRMSWADGEAGQGPVGAAIRSGEPVALDDLGRDAGDAPWLAGARERGFGGFAALPLRASGERLGVLGLFAAHPHALGPEVVSLLQKLADDLGFGLSALRTRALLAGLLDHAPTPIFVTSVDGRMLLVNRAWEEATGLRRAEVLGLPTEAFAAPDAVQVLHDTNRMVLERDGPIRYESDLLVRGVRQAFHTAKFPLRDAAGRVQAIGGVAVDLTARREAEERTRFQARLLEQVADAVVAVDRERRITYLNPAAVARYGLGEPAEALLGRPFPEICGFHFAGPAGEPDAERAVAAGAVWRGELVHRRRDGTTFAVEATVCGLPDELGQSGAMFGVFRDLAEQRRAERALRDSRQQLRALAARLQTVREEETGRIARDLHDELGQLLTGLKMDLRWLETRIGELPAGGGANALLDRVVEASELADRTLTTVQRIAADLRPTTLDQLGLGAALQHEARRFQARTGVACQVLGADGLPELPGEVATALYRIAQEALTNVARHARATRVALTLGVAAGTATLTVEDDGHGLGEVGPQALGLLGMQERATMLGGSVEVGPHAGSGTAVAARIPLAPPGVVPEHRP